MPNYSIWFVGESAVTSSIGTLDGQSNGSNLLGETITFDSVPWEEILISDSDTGFSDSDGNQVLDGTQTLDGVTYASGTRVDAEYQLTVTDGTNTYTLVAVNFHNSRPAARSVEGFAFVGGVPPTGTPLTVTATSQGPSNTDAPATGYDSPPCFTAGTLIRTLDGDIPVEWLQIGDRVITRDNGAQPLRWAGHVHYARRRLSRMPNYRPVRIAAHTFGPNRPDQDVLVSPQHRVLIRNARCELLFGAREVLAAAKHLVDGTQITEANDVRDVTYVHLLFDQHEIVYADGLEAESFLPSVHMMHAFDDIAMSTLHSLLPDMGPDNPHPMRPARPILTAWEARMLATAPEQTIPENRFAAA